MPPRVTGHMASSRVGSVAVSHVGPPSSLHSVDWVGEGTMDTRGVFPAAGLTVSNWVASVAQKHMILMQCHLPISHLGKPLLVLFF